MKTNKLFFALAALTAMAFSSCSKDDAGSTEGNDGKNPIVSLRLAFDNKTGRAVEPGHTGPTSIPTVSTLVVEFLNSSDAVLNTFTYTSKTDIDALQNPGVKVAVNSMATKIRVTGNPTTETNINQMQGYDNVHLYGETTMLKGTGAGTGTGTEADPYKESVTIAPQLARIEVFGGIQPVLGTGNNNSYYAVDVEQIFVNNIKLTENGALDFSQDIAGTPWDDWYDIYKVGGTKESLFDTLVAGPLTAKSAPNANGKFYTPSTTPDRNIGIAENKAAGFNIFPQSVADGADKTVVAGGMPHIILRVKIYKTAQDYTDGKFDADRQFINVRLFNNGLADAGKKYITKMEKSNIYRIDLNDLTGYFIDGVDPADPNPEGNKMFVDMKVTVTPWTITAIKPEL